MFPNADSETVLSRAKLIMTMESAAVLAAAELLDDRFEKAVAILADCKGSVVVSGIGKSGLIGAKISATLSSTGTPSHFMHATEAMHGDLGRIRPSDVVLLLSYSGSTEEVISLAAVLKQDNIPLISISSHERTPLARLSVVPLVVGVIREGCPFNLAPTASTAAMLALGDAIALAASHSRRFTQDDFRRRHPSGVLGRLMIPVSEILRFRVGANVAVSSPTVSVRQALRDADRYPRRSGILLIVDEDDRLAGVLTDADIRRLMIVHGPEIVELPVSVNMNATPVVANAKTLVKDVLQLMRESRLDEVPIVDDFGRPIGVLDVQDLIALKVVSE